MNRSINQGVAAQGLGRVTCFEAGWIGKPSHICIRGFQTATARAGVSPRSWTAGAVIDAAR
jgi:hypothetical protein